MPYENVAKARMLDHLVGNAVTGNPVTTASLHTAYPPTAANEVTGGSPAYARKALTWTAAGVEAAGRVDHGAVTFDVPGGVTVAAVGYWDSSATPVLMATADVVDEAFAAQGTFTLTDASYMHLNL